MHTGESDGNQAQGPHSGRDGHRSRASRVSPSQLRPKPIPPGWPKGLVRVPGAQLLDRAPGGARSLGNRDRDDLRQRVGRGLARPDRHDLGHPGGVSGAAPALMRVWPRGRPLRHSGTPALRSRRRTASVRDHGRCDRLPRGPSGSSHRRSSGRTSSIPARTGAFSRADDR